MEESFQSDPKICLLIKSRETYKMPAIYQWNLRTNILQRIHYYDVLGQVLDLCQHVSACVFNTFILSTKYAIVLIELALFEGSS